MYTAKDLVNHGRVLDDLLELPPELWKDYVGLLEQEICIRSQHFVGSWPSTYSLFVYNRRLATGRDGLDAARAQYFRKLKKDCIDDRAMQQWAHTRYYQSLLERYPSHSGGASMWFHRASEAHC